MAVYGPHIVQQAESYSALSLHQSEMAILWGVTEKTIWQWKKEYPEFAAALERGKVLAIKRSAEVVMQAVIKDKDVAMAQYVLKHRARDRWGDVNTQINLNISPEQLSSMTDEQLAEYGERIGVPIREGALLSRGGEEAAFEELAADAEEGDLDTTTGTTDPGTSE